jgi:integrase
MGVRTTLALVPPVRPADQSALAAALGVRTLPPSLESLAHPTVDVVINVKTLEAEAMRLLHPEASDDLIEQTIGTLAPASYRIYSADATDFARFAASMKTCAMPATPELIAAFALAKAKEGRSYNRIVRKLGAIGSTMAMAGIRAPMSDRLVRKAMARIAREYGRFADHQEEAFRPDELRRALPYLDKMAIEKPERAALILAVITTGQATANRRAELTDFDTDDVEKTAVGMRFRVRKTKTRSETDPPAYIDVRRSPDRRTCPVLALERYAEICRLTPGPLFRAVMSDGALRRTRLSPQTVHAFVRELVREAEIGNPKDYGAHSLRIGHVTSSWERGEPIEEIMKRTLQTSVDQAMHYVRPAAFARTTSTRVFE